MKNKLYGQTAGLKADQTRRLANLYRRRIPREFVITPDIARELFLLSREIRRQIGLLIDRQGRVAHVIVGDNRRIVIPDLSQYRLAPGRLKGLKCVHTHLDSESLSRDDLTDLALLRLDIMAVVAPHRNGRDYRVHAAHIMPSGSAAAS